MNSFLISPHPTLSLWRGLLLALINPVLIPIAFQILPISIPLLLERVRVRRFKNRNVKCNSHKLEPIFVPCTFYLN
jgi:hypothetical protein